MSAASVERRERRQLDWSQASLVHVETADQHGRNAKPGGEALPDFLREHLPQGDIVAQEDDPVVLQRWLEQQERKYLLMTASSHRVTGNMLKALDQAKGWSSAPRGVLSFDHYSDMELIESTDLDGQLSKTHVMHHVLEERLADAVAVFGTDPVFVERKPRDQRSYPYDIVSGRELYTGQQPDVTKFLSALDAVFSHWLKQHIQEVYISVDLDGLRLPELGYTGTDYQPTPAHHAGRPYHGIPASWVPQAMQHARARGLRLGVRHYRTEQRFVGDVVEYTLPDHNQRTARITQHILSAMLAEAQRAATG